MSPKAMPDTKQKQRISGATWVKAAAIIAKEERRRTIYTLCVIILAALTSTLMVASVFPFLNVLANPTEISTMTGVSTLVAFFGITSPYTTLVVVGLGSLVLIVIASAAQIWRLIVLERYSGNQAFTISQSLLAIYLGKPYSFFINRHGSDMATVILSEVGEAVSYFIRPAMELIAALLTTLAIAGLMIWVSPVLALAVFATIGGAYGLTSWLTRSFVRRQGQARAEANAERFRVINEAFDGIKEVKSMGLEGRYLERYNHPATRLIHAIITSRITSQLPRSIIYAAAAGGVIALCLALVSKDAFLAGDALGNVIPVIGLMALAAQRLIPELQRVYSSNNDMQYGIAAIDRVYQDFVSTEVPVFQGSCAPMRLTESFELCDICYRYPNAMQAGLDGISISIKAGEKIGIVGTTGAGKTTLADIVLGLLTPISGTISVDGVKITEQNLRNWQETVGYVPQDIFLTDASMAENIAFGVDRDDIDMARLHEVAKIANIEKLIQFELPDGFDTLLGERGVRLSGGQRQRVGIARAIFRDADMIIFDEATSALDTLTEMDIMTALNALPDTKTTLLIAHRLSTIQACDRIMVIDQGKVAGIGTWQELSETNTIFKDLIKGRREDEDSAVV